MFAASPAKRVFEFQEILTAIIKSQKKNIFIVIEDIDRSGDSGIFFLETLKHFLRNLEITVKHRVIAIVPIGDKSYRGDKYKDGQESKKRPLLKML